MTGWPVVLVMDCKGQAQSAAAVALGFRQMRADVRLAGVVLNRVASARHEALMRHALDPLGIAVLGVLPRDAAIELPERHLGLVQAREHATLQTLLTRAGAWDVPALPRPEVDPTGAGDVSAAAFLVRYHECDDPLEAAAFAACAASCVVEGPGLSSLGDRAEVERRLVLRERLVEDGEWEE